MQAQAEKEAIEVFQSLQSRPEHNILVLLNNFRIRLLALPPKVDRENCGLIEAAY